MYPNLDNNPGSKPSSNQPKKKQGISQDIQNAVIDFKDKFQMQSIKPLFGSYQVFLQMTAKSSPINPLPIKVLFLPNYPQQKPRLYVTKPLSHKLINELTGQIKYQQLLPWTNKTKFIDLLHKIQAVFNTSEIKDDTFTTYVADYKNKLQQYARQINKLSATNIPANPPEAFLQSLKLPQPPVFNFEPLIKEKKYYESLEGALLDNVEIYGTLVVDYNENEAKAKHISERFGKGKILKQMEREMEKCEIGEGEGLKGEGIEAQLAEFHAKRKEYHRMQIIKQKYLDD